MVIDSWNMRTIFWYKYICYERLPKFQTLGVLILTVIWHGSEPRHLFAFIITGNVAIVAARNVSIIFCWQILPNSTRPFSSLPKVRRNVRPFFIQNPVLHGLYDCITWISAIVFLAFFGTSFKLPDSASCLKLSR